MTQYIIYFHQQWVGEHSEEWFAERGPLANAVVEEMKDAGVYVAAGGIEEDLDNAAFADATSGEVVHGAGLYRDPEVYLGGLTIVDVPDAEAARSWAGKLAAACGWPQQVRRMF